MIGGGPAGLMAAEILAAAGVAVDLYEAMPSVGRKLLMAGRGGLNLTHSEDWPHFVARYGTAAADLRPALDGFDAAALRSWAAGLGIETFVGSSGRVFPAALKASPLLRAWLTRLAGLGVRIHTRHRWLGFDAAGCCRIEGPSGQVAVAAQAFVLALGGASWPRLGADGTWAPVLAGAGVALAAFQPANCGVTLDWSETFRTRWAGTPLKTIAVEFAGRRVQGDAVVTQYGLEGGPIYALGAALRDAAAAGGAELRLDLRSGLSTDTLAARLAAPRRGASLGNFLRKAGGLPPVAVALLREAAGGVPPEQPAALARMIKHLPLRVTGTAPLDRAISTAGGVRFEALDEDLMLRTRPGFFLAGEMLDWEAPTGGYLLQACFATGRWAARGALKRFGRA
ncbi:MAG: TIGR03862 family flavoprotein [Aliidongia sp.]